jgi:hypothetical protein
MGNREGNAVGRWAPNAQQFLALARKKADDKNAREHDDAPKSDEQHE